MRALHTRYSTILAKKGAIHLSGPSLAVEGPSHPISPLGRRP